MTEYETCNRCGNERFSESIQTVELVDEWQVCDGCLDALNDGVEYHEWETRYTEAQHERAVELLEEREEIECVKESYEDGAVIVHTPYVSSDVVTDFCNHFGYSIVSFGPVWRAESDWECMKTHGSTFEIHLQYGHQSPSPVPTSVIFQEIAIDRLDGNDKQFG